MIKIAIALLLSVFLCGEHEALSRPLQGTPPQRRSSVQKPPPVPPRSKSQQAQAVAFDAINQILWWLPEDTQTISVVRGPFNVVAPPSELPENMAAVKQVDLSLQVDPLGSFHTIAEGRFYKQLIGHTVSFTVAGSRKFRAPTGLGGMLYEGCDVIVFQQGLGSVRDALLKQMTSNARKVEEISGHPVMMFEEKLEEDIWKIFVAIPQPDVLLCATDRGFLSETLNRMQQKGEKRALPETLPEWQQVDTGAKYWAVRHYDKDDAQSDPSSPLSGVQMAANEPDTQAVGIVFDFDPGRSKAAKIRYLSASKKALRIATKLFNHPNEQFTPSIRQAGPGVIEILVTFDNPGSVMFIFILYGALGHGVYL